MTNDEIREELIEKYRNKSLEEWVKQGIKIYPNSIHAFFPYPPTIQAYNNLSLSSSTDFEAFYKSIQTEYDYNCQYLIVNIDKLKRIIIDIGTVYGLGDVSCEELVLLSLRTFSSYSKKAKELLNKLEQQERVFYLQRFLNAQNSGGLYDNMPDYQTALEEIRAGHKKTHWIWYVFPQMKGLGKSQLSEFYGLNGREEAYAYMSDPILSSRLIEATEAVLNNEHSAYAIFGSDIIKFRACMLLFSTISDNPVFKQVIKKYSW